MLRLQSWFTEWTQCQEALTAVLCQLNRLLPGFGSLPFGLTSQDPLSVVLCQLSRLLSDSGSTLFGLTSKDSLSAVLCQLSHLLPDFGSTLLGRTSKDYVCCLGEYLRGVDQRKWVCVALTGAPVVDI